MTAMSRVASGVSVVVDDEEDDDLVKPDWKVLLTTTLYDSLYAIGIQGGCNSDCFHVQSRSGAPCVGLHVPGSFQWTCAACGVCWLIACFRERSLRGGHYPPFMPDSVIIARRCMHAALIFVLKRRTVPTRARRVPVHAGSPLCAPWMCDTTESAW